MGSERNVTRIFWEEADPLSGESQRVSQERLIDMTKHASDSDDTAKVVKEKEIRVPTWVVQLIRVSVPAVVVLTIMYFDLRDVKTIQTDQTESIKAIQRQIDVLEKNEIKRDGSFDGISATLKNIEKNVEQIDKRTEAMNTSQRKMELDIFKLQTQGAEAPRQ